jgi:hypothetical protein
MSLKDWAAQPPLPFDFVYPGPTGGIEGLAELIRFGMLNLYYFWNCG